ncbi:MAG: penicillin acylase family protein, partial [Crocinitomicaceae bacterium]
MRRLTLSFLFPLIALLMLVLVLDRQVFTAPPLGKTLNPFIGIVQNEKETKSDKTLDLGLKKQVAVHFDKRDVPHLFASNQEDLFFAQGYVCASDRLWQMDFMSYMSAGRLSELFGRSLVDYDRTQRRNGMLYAAKKSLKFMEQDPETKKALDSYTAGVNAWIEQLSYKDYPMEYKLMDYEPEPWTNLKSVLVVKYLSSVLSGYENDIPSSIIRMALGEEKYDELFPNFFMDQDSSSFGITTITDSLDQMDYLDYSFLETVSEVPESKFNPHLGSNSWVVSAGKSATGNAVLCSDPHLNLTLPSIWYEIQLKSDVQNVYGYSIPGVPGIIVGFNDQISWGLTNSSADVIDYHKLILNKDYSAYMFDGKWIETDERIEEIKVKNDKALYDTVFYSNQGPIASDFNFGDPIKRGFALDWSLHNPSNELLSFLQINKAKNNDEFVDAIEHYKCPAQNFSYADVAGNIGMYFRGDVLSRKWKDHGNFVLDGSRSDHFIKTVVKELPSSFNPERGYVFSANNNPYRALGPTLIYGDYDELRADKIDALLKSKERFTLKEMQAMQLNNHNRLAEAALPFLIEAT